MEVNKNYVYSYSIYILLGGLNFGTFGGTRRVLCGAAQGEVRVGGGGGEKGVFELCAHGLHRRHHGQSSFRLLRTPQVTLGPQKQTPQVPRRLLPHLPLRPPCIPLPSLLVHRVLV